MASFKFTVAFFALFALSACLAEETTAKPTILTCYSCGDSEETCNAIDEDKTKTTKCSNADEVCYIAGSWDDEKWNRGCADSKICESDTYKDKDCSTCDDEDKCNGAASVTSSVLFAGVVALLLKYIH